MPEIYQFLGTHEVLIYLLLAIGVLFGVRWLWRSWNEWRHAVYSLEREFALRRIGQSIASLALITVLFFTEFIVASIMYPSLPASAFVSTATPNLVTIPTGPIAPELATAMALTPDVPAAAASGEGCVADRVEFTVPRNGQELRGAVEIRGTADIRNFGHYKYEYAVAGAEVWTPIAAGRDTVRDGQLGRWDTSTLSPGDYQLRLVVSDNQGVALPACVITVRIAPPA
jgi:hypothetical protein